MNSQILPNSLQAERSLLGALLLDNNALYQVQGQISGEDFYIYDHGIVFQAIFDLISRKLPADVVTIADWLEGHPKLDEQRVLAFIGDLVHQTPSAANASIYADIVREKALARRLIRIAKQLEHSACTSGEPVQELIARAQNDLGNLISSSLGNAIPFSQTVECSLETIEQAVKAKNANELAGIPTGLGRLDKYLNGLRKGNLVLIAGRPAMGKTCLALQIAFHAAKNGKPVLYLSLEMGHSELGTRILAGHFGMDASTLTGGDRFAHQAIVEKISQSNGFDKLPLWIDDSTYSLDGVVARATEMRYRHSIALLTVDHIGLVQYSANNRVEGLGQISRRLKMLSKDLQIPVVALSQLSRNPAHEKRRPRLSDLRDSGHLEQDSDVVLCIHSEDTSLHHMRSLEIGLLKNRSGTGGGWLKNFSFNTSLQRIRDDG